MSHFSVLVNTLDNDQQSLEDVLAPYQENNMGDCPKEFLVFEDVTDESLKLWEEGTSPGLRHTITNKVFSKYDERFRNPKYNPLNFEKEPQFLVPEDWVEEETPFKDLYLTFEFFMEKYRSYPIDPDTGRYGLWENPNAKWDWYEVGGRFQGLVKLRPEQAHENVWALQGEVGTLSKMEGEIPTGWDSAQHKDIDWASMHRERYEAAYQKWERFEQLLKVFGMEPDEYLVATNKVREIAGRGEGFKDRETTAIGEVFGIDRQTIREIRDTLGFNKEKRFVGGNPDWALEQLPGGMETPDIQPLDGGDQPDGTYKPPTEWRYVTREEHFSKNGHFCTFALLDHKGWAERGSMGWWGAVSDPKDPKSWGETWKERVESWDPASYCWVVDCHI